MKVEVLGHTIDKKHYPILFKWAKTNIATLETQLQSLAERAYDGDVISAMQMLESDLEHAL